MKKDYYVVLHGAKKNVGDYLIRDRAKKLLNTNRTDRDLVELPSWEKLDNSLDLINKSKGLIIMGGPGIFERTYPYFFPLVDNLDDIKVQIYFMGTGSYITPTFKNNILNYKLNDKTKKLFNRSIISVRDYISKEVLEYNGITDVTVTGCPAWYDERYILNKFVIPSNINNIFLSAPAGELFFPQFINILKYCKSKFPNSNLIVGFNRGYTQDSNTSKRLASYTSKYKNIILDLGIDIVDLSSDLNKFEEYADYDLHIGYRLHSHILFLSRRKPTYIIAEDSRSLGNYETLMIPGFNGMSNNFIYKLFPLFQNIRLHYLIYKLFPSLILNKHIINELNEKIDLDIDNDFISFQGLDIKLNIMYKKMQSWLKKLR